LTERKPEPRRRVYKKSIFYRVRGEYELAREYTTPTPFRPAAALEMSENIG